MMTLFHIPIPLSIGLLSHQPVMGMQFYPTTVSYWETGSGGRSVLLKRVQKPLMLRDTTDGWEMLTSQCHRAGVICYLCVDYWHNPYYSIGPNILSIMLGKRFLTAKKRIYPACPLKKRKDVPQLVPQLTWYQLYG